MRGPQAALSKKGDFLMPITDILEKNCRLYGDDVCLVEINPEMPETRRVTWKEYELIEPVRASYYRREITWNVFNEKSNRFANLLLERGIKKGDKVAILLMNCLEWLPIYFGILKTGALAVPLNFRYSAEEDVLVFGPEFIGRVEEIADSISKHRLLYYVGDGCPGFAEDYTMHSANCSSQSPKIDINDDDYAAIYFSSGTTGFPKAILHTHEALLHSAKVEQNHHGQTKDDVFLCIPPLYHTGAKMHWFGSFLTGGKAVLLKGTNPEFILRAVSEEKCTIVWLLVPWAQDLLLALDSGKIKLEMYQLDQWRLMHIGAQPVPRSLIKHWKEYFPHHQYDTNYGLSESIGPGCVHLGVENIHKVGAIGKAGFGWETKIIDEQGNPVEQGKTGELAVKGPGVMVEYYNDKKAVIISGGENIYPVQIEDFLRTNDAILDVAVIGLPDERLGEIAAAIIALKPGVICMEDDIDQFCKKLPRYKRPRKVIFADVPRNATGKIEKPRLREMYGAAHLVEEQNRR